MSIFYILCNANCWAKCQCYGQTDAGKHCPCSKYSAKSKETDKIYKSIIKSGISEKGINAEVILSAAYFLSSMKEYELSQTILDKIDFGQDIENHIFLALSIEILKNDNFINLGKFDVLKNNIHHTKRYFNIYSKDMASLITKSEVELEENPKSLMLKEYMEDKGLTIDDLSRLIEIDSPNIKFKLP